VSPSPAAPALPAAFPRNDNVMLALNELAVPGNTALLLWLTGHAEHIDLSVLRATFALFDPRLFPLQAAACAWLRARQRAHGGSGAAVGGLHDLFFCLLCLALAVGLVGVTKIAVDAPRPALLLSELLPRLAAGDPYSFPSGHAAAAAASVFLLWPLAGAWVRTALALLLAWVMATRCIAGLHFPLDVATGAALAFAACICVSRAHDWLRRRRAPSVSAQPASTQPPAI